MGTGGFNAGGKPAIVCRPIQGGSIPSHYMPQKPELSAGLMGLHGQNADFTYLCSTGRVNLYPKRLGIDAVQYANLS